MANIPRRTGKFELPAEIADKLQKLGQSTHAGLVLVSASVISEDLRRLLESKMRKLTKKEGESLFEGYAPLSTFSGRISLCYALEYIDADLHADLKTLKKIRNHFAHSEDAPNLNAEKVVAWIDAFRDPDGTDPLSIYYNKSQAISRALKALTPKPSA